MISRRALHSQPLLPRQKAALWAPEPLPAIWVLQGAPGAGKTSSAALIAEGLGSPTLWISGSLLAQALASRRDGDAAALAVSLWEQVRSASPGGATVILDGLEAVVTNPDAAAFLRAWLQPVAAPWRTLLTSREGLPVPLSRRIAAGEVLLLDTEDLRLTPEEATVWLADAEIATSDLDALSGWPLGVHALVSMARRPERQSLLEGLVSEELLDPLPEDLRALAVRLAPLPILDPSAILRAIPGVDAPMLLGRLQSAGVAMREAWLPLARKCLLREWQAAFPKAERVEHLKRLVGWLVEVSPAETVAMLLDHGETASAVDLLKGQRSRLLAGDSALFESLLARFPAEAFADFPDLLLSEGALFQAKGAFAEAEARFRQALDRFRSAGVPSKTFESLGDLLHLYWTKQDHDAFRRIADEARELEAHAEPAERAEYYNNLACFHFGAGSEDEARALFRKVLDHPHFGSLQTASVQQFASINLGILAMERGEFDEAGRYYHRVISLSEEFRLKPSVPRGARLYLASIALKLGDRRQAEAHFQALADNPFPVADAYRRAEFSALEGEYHLMTGAFPDADRSFLEALRIFASIQMDTGADAGAATNKLAVIHRRRGEGEAAMRLHAKALPMVEDWPRYKACLLLDWAITLMTQGKLEEAETKLGETEALFERAPAFHLKAAVGLAKAVLAQRSGRDDEARIALDGALTVLRQGPYYYVAISQREIAPDLWALMVRHGHADLLAKIEGHFPQAALAIRSELENRPAASVTSVELPPVAPAALEIRCLGSLEVRVAGEPIAWPRKKAKALLASLLLGPQGLGREALCERLFPDSGWEEAEHQLDVMTSTLRKSLEPGLARRQKSRYLTIKDKHYRFEFEGVWLDVEVFRGAYRDGMKAWQEGERETAVSAFERAVELYRADLLSEPLLMEWFDLERHQFRSWMLEMLTLLAQHDLDVGLVDRAREALERILSLEATNEEAHCRLMELYARHGQTDLLRRQYELCTRLLLQELDTEPSAETRELFERLTR